MIRKLVYENSRGESVVFGGESGWHFRDTDIFNLAQTYSAVGGKIVGFERGVSEFSLMSYMRRGSDAERDRFINIVSYDSRVGVPGRLYAGASYMECYVMGYELANWHIFDYWMDVDLKIVSDHPAWVAKAEANLVPERREEVAGLNYPHGYPHNYGYDSGNSNIITNPFQLPAKADIYFAGPCVQPYVIIAGNRYQVRATAENGELIVIRGFEQRGAKQGVFLRGRDGTERAIFAQGVREPGAMCFAEIPVGQHSASWGGNFPIAVEMYEERNTPLWQQM